MGGSQDSEDDAVIKSNGPLFYANKYVVSSDKDVAMLYTALRVIGMLFYDLRVYLM